MIIVNLIILLIFFYNYIFLIFDQNRFINLTISRLVKAKANYYELEGWIYYAISFYKTNFNSINLPYSNKLYHEKDLNSYIILEIYDDLNDKEKLIIKVSRYINNLLKDQIVCDLKSIKNKFEIQNIFLNDKNCNL